MRVRNVKIFREDDWLFFVIKVSSSGALTNPSFLVDVPRHDPNFALARLQIDREKTPLKFSLNDTFSFRQEKLQAAGV